MSTRGHDALTCEKAILRLTAAAGAGDHCGIKNRSTLNRRVFERIDGIFAR
jgi:hypothetical protein